MYTHAVLPMSWLLQKKAETRVMPAARHTNTLVNFVPCTLLRSVTVYPTVQCYSSPVHLTPLYNPHSAAVNTAEHLARRLLDTGDIAAATHTPVTSNLLTT